MKNFNSYTCRENVRSNSVSSKPVGGTLMSLDLSIRFELYKKGTEDYETFHLW